ncbi:unnamed protein product [Echinostoma caproni]|uniref:NEDD8-activating enzyme E1 catalytic subunit n=1 Tax=Echinostoma caproni TaxID=27848 RepID=A0A183ATF9_9TREM|nr:unnamed protein product [Echinostoma caproni]
MGDASLVVYNEDGTPDPTTVIPLVDGGTEGFKGHVLVVLYGLTGCVECSLDLYPPQLNFPLCTIAHTPRLPEHCVEYIRILLWPKEQPFGVISIIAYNLWNSDFYLALTAFLKSKTLGDEHLPYALHDIPDAFRLSDSCGWPEGFPQANISVFDPSATVDCIFRHYKLTRTSPLANIAVNQGVVVVFLSLYVFYMKLELVTTFFKLERHEELFTTIYNNSRLRTHWYNSFSMFSRWLKIPISWIAQLKHSAVARTTGYVINQMCIISGQMLSSFFSQSASLVPFLRRIGRLLTGRTMFWGEQPQKKHSVPNLSQLTPSDSEIFHSMDESSYSLVRKPSEFKQLLHVPRTPTSPPSFLLCNQSFTTGHYPVRRRHFVLDWLGLDYDRRFGVLEEFISLNSSPVSNS